MSATLNKAMFIGNVGKDPIIRQFDNGSIATFTLAVTEKYKDRNNQPQEKTEWINIVANGQLAEVVKNYVSKGTSLYVETRFRNREFTGDDGQKKYIAEFVCQSLQLLSKPQQSNDAQSAQKSAYPSQQNQQAAQRNMYRNQPVPQPVNNDSFEEDGDLPF